MAGGMTGMDVTKHDAIMDGFGQLKKATTKFQYMSFSIKIEKDGTKNVGKFVGPTMVEKVDGEDSKTAYEKMLATLTPDEPAFVIFDTHFETRDGRPQQKLGMLVWCPDTLDIKRKMMVGANKDAIKGALDGVSKDLHATDMDEAAWTEFVGMF